VNSILSYQQENKTRVKQSYKYRHHCAEYTCTRLQIQGDNHRAPIWYIVRKLDKHLKDEDVQVWCLKTEIKGIALMQAIDIFTEDVQVWCLKTEIKGIAQMQAIDSLKTEIKGIAQMQAIDSFTEDVQVCCLKTEIKCIPITIIP
jgi:hypothetical protein